jgi:hypothetical protein
VKAKPVILLNGEYIESTIADATHLTIKLPGPSGRLTLPIILKGTREGTGCWTWNGDTEKPTLKPSVLTKGGDRFTCHSWITNGQAIFLSYCTHGLANKTLDLLDV